MGMKQTDIGLIPDDWDVKKIGEIADSFAYGVGAESVPYNGKVKYIRITDIDDVNGKYVPQPVMSPAFFTDNHIVKENDLLIARTGASVGKSYLYNSNDGCLIFAGFLMKMNINKECSSFIFYKTQSAYYKNWVLQESARTGQPGLNLEQIKELRFALPPTTAEQRRIASALQNIDNLIAALVEQIAKKQAIKQGAMQQLLTGKTRLKGYEGKWIEKKVEKMGYTYTGLSGKTKDDFGSGNAKYITFLNVLNNAIIDTNIFEKVNVDPKEKQNKALKNDIFFNTSSETPEEVGICAVLNENVENLYLNSFCFGFRITDADVSGLYLAYFWRSKQGRDIMTALAQGATRYNLSKTNFNAVVITLPPTIEEQNAITNVLTNMDSEIRTLQTERDKYTAVKQGMMQQLLTGKTRI